MSHISIETMAKVTQLTPEEYQECESGTKDMTFAFLYTCANHLGVDVGEIITGVTPRLATYTVCRAGDGMPVKRREGFQYFHLASALKKRLAEPCLVKVKYDEQMEKTPVSLTAHAGQELDYVLKGTLRIKVGGHVEILKAGDSIYFDASKPHGMVAIGGEDC